MSELIYRVVNFCLFQWTWWQSADRCCLPK